MISEIMVSLEKIEKHGDFCSSVRKVLKLRLGVIANYLIANMIKFVWLKVIRGWVLEK